MTLKTSKKFIGSLFKELYSHEVEAAKLNKSKDPFTKKIGHVVFSHNKKTGTVDLYIGVSEEDDTHKSYANLVRFKDGTIGIVMEDTHGLFTNVRLVPALLGAIAHELGHYINGDLEEKTINEEFFLRGVDINFEKQKALTNSGHEEKYVKCVVSSILKGGVLQGELAADVTAVQLNGLPNLLMAKMLDDSEVKNMLILIEKRNRINRLIEMTKDGSLSQEAESSFELAFD